jgi:PAS domain S-box-containing protein
MNAPFPKNELERLTKLSEYEILNTPPEKLFDDIVKLATIICGTPIGLATLIDKDKQWFKAKVGVPIEMVETDRSIAICSHTILNNEPLVIPNLSEDVRFSNNPLVTGETNVRFYAGVPLTTEDGFNLGALCVIDQIPRQLTPEQVESLQYLAQQLVNQLELRKINIKIEREKNQTTREFNDLLTSLDNCVWSFPVEKENSDSYLSPSAEKVFGYSIEYLSIPSNIFKIVHLDDLNSFKEWLRSLTDKNSYLEYRLIQSNGDVVWIESKARIFSENGIPLRLEGISMNITDKKNTYALIQTQNEKLAISAKLAALGEMSASISHEIKNPLSVISNSAAYLAVLAENSDTVDSKEIIECAEMIERTVIKTSKIINSLKAFSRTGSSDPFVLTNLNSIVEDILSLCKHKFVSANVEFTYPTVDKNIKIECRSSEVYQVLINILNNSFDAIESQSKKWINLDFKDANDFVEFNITDCGSGIPLAVQAKIFDSFFTTKDIGKGTGLGLSISKKIIESHGGSLSIDNNCKNTRFIIKLPKVQSIQVNEAA